jgi:hypothetical protein
MADEQPPPGENPNAIASGAPPSVPVSPDAVKSEPRQVPSIALDPAVASTPKPASKDAENKDTVRELLETIVFVVVLVLMLKTFLAEAFVIPTGSMATTLLGYHYKITCEQCGYRNLVNASPEAEPQRGEERAMIVSCQCQNCGWTNAIRNVPQIRPGDPQP